MPGKGLWVRRSGRWWNRNQGFLDAFVLGVTEPTAANTGIRANGLDTSMLTVVSGDVTLGDSDFPSNKVIEGKYYKGFVTVWTSTPVTFRNCYFEGRGFSGETNPKNGLVSCTNTSNSAPVNFEFCTFWSVNPMYQQRCITGAGIGHVTRCDLGRGEDLLAVYPTAQTTIFGAYGNYFHDLSFWDHDPQRASDSVHPGWTHNDCIQINGSNGVAIVGNSFHAFADPTSGNYSTLTSGGYPTGAWNSCLMLNTGTGRHENLTIDQNWFYGAEAQIQMPKAGGSYDTGCSMTVTNNRFSLSVHGLGPYSGNYSYQMVRWSVTGPTASAVDSSNVYMADAATPAGLRGTSIPTPTYSSGAQQWASAYATPTSLGW